MKNFAKKISIYAIFLFSVNLINANSFASQGRNLTIFAEPNMATAISKIGRLFSQKNNIIISVNLNSSEDLASTIESGDPVDIFISAHNNLIEGLRQKGLIDVYNVGFIARDELVLITKKTNPNLSKNACSRMEDCLKSLSQNKETLVIDYSGSSLGEISKEVLRQGNFTDLIISERVPEDKSSSIEKFLNNDEKLFALVFRSQMRDPDLTTIAQSANRNIFYQALVVAGDNMESAREFLKFLKNSTSKKILKESGFILN